MRITEKSPCIEWEVLIEIKANSIKCHLDLNKIWHSCSIKNGQNTSTMWPGLASAPKLLIFCSAWHLCAPYLVTKLLGIHPTTEIARWCLKSSGRLSAITNCPLFHYYLTRVGVSEGQANLFEREKVPTPIRIIKSKDQTFSSSNNLNHKPPNSN